MTESLRSLPHPAAGLCAVPAFTSIVLQAKQRFAPLQSLLQSFKKKTRNPFYTKEMRAFETGVIRTRDPLLRRQMLKSN